jgi:hypothetical protein
MAENDVSCKIFFSMANNLEHELNIDGILIEICSTCVYCPGQSINIWFLSDTVRQRSSSNFSMWGIFLKLLVFHLNLLIYTGCANEMCLGQNMCFSF